MSNPESLMTEEEWNHFGLVPLRGVKLVLPNLPDQDSEVIRGDMVLIQGIGRRFYDLVDGDHPLSKPTEILIYLGFAEGDTIGERSYAVHAWAHFDGKHAVPVEMYWEGEVVNPLGSVTCREKLARGSHLVCTADGYFVGDDHLQRYSEAMCRFCSTDLGRAIELNSHRLPKVWKSFGEFLKGEEG